MTSRAVNNLCSILDQRSLKPLTQSTNINDFVSWTQAVTITQRWKIPVLKDCNYTVPSKALGVRTNLNAVNAEEKKIQRQIVTVDHSLKPFDFILIFLFSWIPMTTIINTSCKTVFQHYFENQPSYPKRPNMTEAFSPLSLSRWHYSHSCNKRKMSQKPTLHMLIFPLNPSSYAEVLIPSKVSVWGGRKELKPVKGLAGLHTVLFNVFLRHMTKDNSSENREANIMREQLSKEFGVPNALKKSDCSNAFSEIFSISIAKPTFFLFFFFPLLQTAFPPHTGGNAPVTNKFPCQIWYPCVKKRACMYGKMFQSRLSKCVEMLKPQVP